MTRYGTFALTAAMVIGSTAAAHAQSHSFFYESTTDPVYNQLAHLRNTGLYVTAGQDYQISGLGDLHLGAFDFKTSFQMGMISPLADAELARSFESSGPDDWQAYPIVETGETVFFAQDRQSQFDSHDITITAKAQSSGFVFVGIYDSYFQDNTGTHELVLTLIPEPATGACVLLGGLALISRRRPRVR